MSALLFQPVFSRSSSVPSAARHLLACERSVTCCTTESVHPRASQGNQKNVLEHNVRAPEAFLEVLLLTLSFFKLRHSWRFFKSTTSFFPYSKVSENSAGRTRAASETSKSQARESERSDRSAAGRAWSRSGASGRPSDDATVWGQRAPAPVGHSIDARGRARVNQVLPPTFTCGPMAAG